MRVNGKKALTCNELICHWKFNVWSSVFLLKSPNLAQ